MADTDIFDFEDIKLEKAEQLKKRAELFDSLESRLGSNALNALKEHYALYDDRYYLWIANLYDPGEYDADGNSLGGGFYFSNSARDNAEFGIDIESTMQILHFIRSERSGFLSGSNRGIKDALPDKMKTELVSFARSLQSSKDGYFYHPQWESIGTSRKGRDLRWATQLFNLFEEKPLWDTPSGLSGLNGAPGESVCESSDGAVSEKRISNRTWRGSEQLQTLESWEQYLRENMDKAKNQSWTVGNLLSAQYMEILERERVGISRGEFLCRDGSGIADDGVVRMTERIINSYQKPNGMWQETPLGTPTFYGVNGIMKFSELYTNLGLKLNYPMEALRAAIEIATLEGADADEKEHRCTPDVFNPLVALRNRMHNMRKFGDARLVDSLEAELLQNAENLIRVSTSKLKKYKKDDGSIGYAEGGTSGTSQNAPVAIRGTVEGDVNGADIATGVTSHLCLALGLPILPMFTPADFKIFLNVIASRVHSAK